MFEKVFLTVFVAIQSRAAFIFYSYTENHSLEVGHLKIKVPELSENWNGLTIVHLSDIQFPNNRIATKKLIAETKKLDCPILDLK